MDTSSCRSLRIYKLKPLSNADGHGKHVVHLQEMVVPSTPRKKKAIGERNAFVDESAMNQRVFITTPHELPPL